MHHSVTRQTAWAFGLLLTFLGILGFVAPGIFAPSGTPIGFVPDLTRNLFYLALGIVGIFTLFEKDNFTRTYLLIAGVVFSLLAVDGLVWDGMLLNVFVTLPLDHYLHLALGAIALVVAVWDLEQKGGKKKGWR